MKNLELRIARLESVRCDPVNDFFYRLVCRFTDSGNRPKPEKQDDIVLTLRQLSKALPQ